MVSAALGAVAQLRIPDHLADGPRSAADLAARTGANEDAIYRVLRALSMVGVFTETAPRTYLERNPELAARFNNAMTNFSAGVAPADCRPTTSAISACWWTWPAATNARKRNSGRCSKGTASG
jgi:hypothetical protein